MFSCIKQSFHLTNKNIFLATPLILFSLLSSLYILFSIGGSFLSVFFAIILSAMMLGAFLSGWFYLIKSCVSEPEREDVNSLIKEFPSGVGEYFLPILGGLLVCALITFAFLGLTYFAGMNLFGKPEFSPEKFSSALSSIENLKTFLYSLPKEDLMKLNNWSLLTLVTTTLNYFLILFFFPVILFKEKNPLKAFFISLKDLFSKNFLKNIGLFIFVNVTYFVLSTITTIFCVNAFTHFFCTLLNYYYLVFVAVLLFNYYYTNFIKTGGIFDATV